MKMAVLYVKSSVMESEAVVLSDIVTALEAIKDEIYSVGNGLPFQMEAISRIKSNLKTVAGYVSDEAAFTGVLSAALSDAAAVYRSYEATIVNNVNGETLSGEVSGGEVIPQISVDKNVEDMTSSEIVDFLTDLTNIVSLHTTGDSLVSRILGKIIEGFDGGMFGDCGNLIGLATGMAADIMYAMNHGSTQNALLADIIADVAFFCVGEFTDDLGSLVGGAVGASAGGPLGAAAGKVIGDFVGGVVGDGAVFLMNIDLNGEAEGGIAKDAMTDWLDNQLDYIFEDVVLEPAF